MTREAFIKAARNLKGKECLKFITTLLKREGPTRCNYVWAWLDDNGGLCTTKQLEPDWRIS